MLRTLALAGVAQWVARRPANQRVAGSMPGQGTGLSCGLVPSRGRARAEATTH